MAALTFEPGGYRFVKGVFQYSAGVASMPGYRHGPRAVPRARSARRGIPRGSSRIIERGRASAHRILRLRARSPAPFTESGFRCLQLDLCRHAGALGDFRRRDQSGARSNVCPAIDPPAEPSFHAFTYTESAPDAEPSFVVAGSGEAPEGRGNYRDHIVRLGTSGLPACGEGALRAWRNGAPHVGDRLRLDGYDGDAALHRPRHPSVPRRRDRPPRRGALWAHLALQPPAGGRSGLRDGLPRRAIERTDP